MAKPLADQTDEELEEALAEGKLDERKAAIAREILSRRQEANAEAVKRRFGWLGGVIATLGLAFVALKRLWMRSRLSNQ
jgi:DNA mismatch repair protein MutH